MILRPHDAPGKAGTRTPDELLENKVVRKLPDPLDCRDRFQEKSVTQARDLPVVVRNRFVELLPGDFGNADVHFPQYFASTCSSGIALISPRR